jgi:hypothetical protein
MRTADAYVALQPSSASYLEGVANDSAGGCAMAVAIVEAQKRDRISR